MKTHRYRKGPASLFAIMFGVCFIGMVTALIMDTPGLPMTPVYSAVAVFFLYGAIHHLACRVKITPDAVIRSGSLIRRISFRSVKAIRIEEKLVGIETWWFGRYDLANLTDMENLINEVLAAAARYPGIQIYDVRGTE